MTVQELHDILWHGIRSGELQGRLPSSAEMKRRYGTGHNTVHLAIDRLKMQGLVYGRQGKGVYVNRQTADNSGQGTVMVYFGQVSGINIPLYSRMLGLIKAELDRTGSRLEFVSSLTGDLQKYHAALVFGANLMPGSELMMLKYAMSGRIVLINHKIRGLVSVSNDNVCGGRLATERLYQAGHRHIAVVTRYLDMERNFFHDRFQGVTDFAAEHKDLTIHEFRIPSDSQSRNKICAEIAEKIISGHPEITGLFAFTDWYAFQLLQVLKQAGRTISAVGYDNSEFASLLDPPLTSIEEDAAGLGHAVCRTVNELIAGEKPVSREVKPHLIERQSVFSIQDIK